jgi:uncharacterized glyoxalase superfamily protein PhnB/uncharacterized protein YndB with AHSA1/START domain
MKNNLLFDFTVNKESNSIHIKREFAADIDLVWDAWTKSELLDLWWAPKPYRAETKSLEFHVGGTWLYAMVSPENEKQWCKADYKAIEEKKSLSWLDAFCDENGRENNDKPRSLWFSNFAQKNETTTVELTLQQDSLADLEWMVKMGLKEGFAAALENLDQYFEAQFRLRNENRTDDSPRVCTYLNFPGNTEEAFLFYKSVFKTEFIGKGIQRFGDIPQDANHPPVDEAIKKMILHVELPITGNHVLMATDSPKEMGFTLNSGNNMHICIEPGSKGEAKRIFDELSSGGNVTMPLEDMFFGAYFGSFTDKYGINWMINVKL